MKLKLGVTSDHAGKELKQMVFDFLCLTDHEIVDYGVSVDTDKAVDYPDYAALLAKDISDGKIDKGIAICGSGLGVCVVANKFPRVRATSVWDEFSARMSRMHNDSNVICIGARAINHHRVVALIKIWLETPYEGGRHDERIKKIADIEKKNFEKPQN